MSSGGVGPQQCLYFRPDRHQQRSLRPGGHGKTFDWSLLKNVKRAKPMMLSGGIHPGNVAQAIETVRPDAVDVSSGVETAPGRKDPNLIRAFIAAARTAAAVGALQQRVAS